MPFPFLAGAAAGLPFAGGVIANRARSAEAMKDRNFQSLEADASRTFTSAQAKRQMDFQERMRSTEWQTAVEDMKMAGLNPALAYQQGGAATPSGASGGGASASGSRANQEDVVSGAVSSAMQYKRLKADVDSIRAGITKTKAETEAIRGRPGRILEPLVTRGAESMRDFFTDRTLGILNFEAGSSARSIAASIKRLYDRIQGGAGRLRARALNLTGRY